MFSISVAMGAVQWRLLFKTEETARNSWTTLTAPTGSPMFQLADDFGQKIVAKYDSVGGLMFEDMDQSKLANVELMLFNASAQAMAQKRAQTDPAFRTQPQGPAIIDPMRGNGRFPG